MTQQQISAVAISYSLNILTHAHNQVHMTYTIIHAQNAIGSSMQDQDGVSDRHGLRQTRTQTDTDSDRHRLRQT